MLGRCCIQSYIPDHAPLPPPHPSSQCFWHSSAHVLGQALELELGADLTIGPALEEGFYYDCFLEGRTLNDLDKPRIEKRIKEVGGLGWWYWGGIDSGHMHAPVSAWKKIKTHSYNILTTYSQHTHNCVPLPPHHYPTTTTTTPPHHHPHHNLPPHHRQSKGSKYLSGWWLHVMKHSACFRKTNSKWKSFRDYLQRPPLPYIGWGPWLTCVRGPICPIHHTSSPWQ